MRTAVLLSMLALAPLGAQRATPGRGEIGAMEKYFDQKIRRYSIDTPMEALGLTRGLYLDGYGVVFTTEVNLLLTAGISPFRPQISHEEVARVKAAKQKRLPELRALMRDMLVWSAGSLDRLPVEEQIVVGVMLFYNNWEDTAGMPQTITMKGKKSALLLVATDRMPKSALDTIVQVREE